jgi:hypothetical protein
MNLTRSNHQAYHAPASEKNEAGIDILIGAATSRKHQASGFFSPVRPVLGGRAGGPQGRRCSIGMSTPVSVALPIDMGLAVTHRNWSKTMSKLTPTAGIEVCKSLFDHHPEDVIAPLGYAGEALGWLEELFRTIVADAPDERKRYRIKQLAELGAHVACESGNFAGSMHETFQQKLQEAGIVLAKGENHV